MKIQLNEEESKAIEHLAAAQEIIFKWGLYSNKEELTSAIHTIQFFIIMHMLRRENPSQFNDWYSHI